METAIRITISLGDAREGIDRILDNPYFECLQRTATNQWESERFDDEDEDDFDDDKLTEESYRTTFDDDPENLGLEAEDVADEYDE